jgi:hypothetical protein
VASVDAVPDPVAVARDDGAVPEPVAVASVDAVPEPVAVPRDDCAVPDPVAVPRDDCAVPDPVAVARDDCAVPDPVAVARDDCAVPDPVAVPRDVTDPSALPSASAVRSPGAGGSWSIFSSSNPRCSACDRIAAVGSFSS